jgi:hypothetical protein
VIITTRGPSAATRRADSSAIWPGTRNARSSVLTFTTSARASTRPIRARNPSGSRMIEGRQLGSTISSTSPWPSARARGRASRRTLVTTGTHHGGLPARPRRMASVSMKMPRHVGQRHAPPRPRRPIGCTALPREPPPPPSSPPRPRRPIPGIRLPARSCRSRSYRLIATRRASPPTYRCASWPRISRRGRSPRSRSTAWSWGCSRSSGSPEASAPTVPPAHGPAAGAVGGPRIVAAQEIPADPGARYGIIWMAHHLDDWRLGPKRKGHGNAGSPRRRPRGWSR